MLAKLIDGALSCAPRKIIIDGKTIFNPGEELLKEQGYKDVETVDMPDDAPEGKLYVSGWTDSVDAIQQTWTLVDAPPKSKEELAVKLAVRQINTMSMDDKESLYFLNLYPTWEELCESGYKAEKPGYKFRYGDKLYRTVKNNTKFDGKNIPGEDGGKYFREVIPEMM